MKLIHCADLHLDSPMQTHLPADHAGQRRQELLSTFARLVEHADRNRVDAILIAGDLFDSSRATRKTERYVLDTVAAHPDLAFFYLAGNHDSGAILSSDRPLPDNLHTFGDGWQTYEFGDVMITGSERPDPDTLNLPAGALNVVLLHGQADASRNASPGDRIPLKKYRDKNIDYLALGHIHTYGETELDSRCTACYCGCPEGRGFDECGRKGFVLLETDGGRITHTFVPFAKRTLHEVTVDLSDVNSQPMLEQLVSEALATIPGDDMVKLVLTGDASPDAPLDLPRLEGLLDERFYFAKLADKTRLRIDPEDYAHDVSLKGEFIRMVLADRKLSDGQKERVIACGLRVLRGEEPDL